MVNRFNPIGNRNRYSSMFEDLQLALKQIEFARHYTKTLLEDIDLELWYTQPEGLPTHVAWQVGHLAMAQYGLMLFRIRGRTTEDRQLMPNNMRKMFSRGTTAQPPGEKSPSAEEIRDVFDRVYDAAMAEAPTFTREQLDTAVEMPYAATPTCMGCLLFCSHHEMIHAGQIGMLRRALGKEPVR